MGTTGFIVLIFTLLVANGHATDLFVRPSGCSSDVRLIKDDSYRELVNKTVGDCAAQCLADGPWCRSVSYYDNPTNSTKICALNIGHSDAVWTGLRYTKYWAYYHRISQIIGAENLGIAKIDTCQPNTFRDCHTAYLATNNGTDRDIWLKLDNSSEPIRARCYKGREILMLQRTGIGFYDISWNRPWDEYKWGFGNGLENFWFGLDTMYRITNQDFILRWSSSPCVFPRKINGTTTRLTLSDTLQYRCPWWGVRGDAKIVLSLRSLCICEDTVNPQGEGHVQLCGCNEPGRNHFIWSEELKMIISPRQTGGNRCLRIKSNTAGEEIEVADCNQADSYQKWTQQLGRYTNFWSSRDIYNSVRTMAARHTVMKDEPWNYELRADPYSGCGSLWAKVQQNIQFSAYDKDNDRESRYNLARRQAGGDWWSIYGWADGGDPKLTAQRELHKYNFCGSYSQWGMMSLKADDWWY